MKIQTENDVTLSQPNSLRNSFILAEYNRIYSEIRVINYKSLEYSKLYLGIATSLFLYSFGGIIYADKLRENFKYLFAYSLLGALFILILLVITLFLFIELANSKKIKLRYWKLIDIMRGFMKNKYPELWDALALPPLKGNQATINSRLRPHHTKNEVVGYVLMGIFLEMIWLVVLVYFLTNMIEAWETLNKLRLLQSIMLSDFIFIIILLAAPFNLMKIRKMFKEGKLVDENNIYPVYPYGVHSKWLNYIFVGYGIVIYFYLSFILFINIKGAISNEYFYFYSVTLIFIDIYFILVGLLYFKQKYISAKLIYSYKSDHKSDPIAVWKSPFRFT